MLQALREKVSEVWEAQEVRKIHNDVARARQKREALLSMRMDALVREQTGRAGAATIAAMATSVRARGLALLADPDTGALVGKP
jgi:hypothetical protein